MDKKYLIIAVGLVLLVVLVCMHTKIEKLEFAYSELRSCSDGNLTMTQFKQTIINIGKIEGDGNSIGDQNQVNNQS